MAFVMGRSWLLLFTQINQEEQSNNCIKRVPESKADKKNLLVRYILIPNPLNRPIASDTQ